MKKDNRYSLISPLTGRCMLCGSTDRVAIHEVFFGSSNRKKSIEDGMCVNLCWYHHNGSNYGVHFNKDLDLKLKKQAEKVWIAEYTDKDDSYQNKIDRFIKRYGKNYLMEEDINGNGTSSI